MKKFEDYLEEIRTDPRCYIDPSYAPVTALACFCNDLASRIEELEKKN